MNLVLFGAPGSGKGTQAERLKERFSLKHISTGDLLREAVANGTELGKKVESILASGELVSDDIVLELIREAVAGAGADESLTGWMLDGFPRTIGQAEALDRLLDGQGEAVDSVIVLDVDRDAVIKRLSARRVCVDCKAVYSTLVNPPAEDGKCDKCGGQVIQRKDDQPGTIANRLDVYEEQTRPILDYNAGRLLVHDLVVHHVNGIQSVAEVAGDIERVLK
jgi:adenylate kinase